MYKRILKKLEQATKHYNSCRAEATSVPRKGLYYCQGAFCNVIFSFACVPFFLRKRKQGYAAYRRSSAAREMSFDEFLKKRRIAAIATVTFVGIAGLTVLRPIFEGNVLPRKFVTVYESETPNSWEVFFETDLYSTSTYNFLDDRYPFSAGHLAVWQQKTEKGWQVRVYDNEARQIYRLTDETGDHIEVRTDGRYVVWQGRIDGKWRIYVWDSEQPDDKPVAVTDSTNGNAIRPRISEGVMVWQEWIRGNWEIMKKEVANPQRRRLTSNDRHDIRPDILGQLIVWQAKGDDGNSQIRVFHQRIEEEAGVLYDAPNQIRPRFDSRGYLHWFAYEEEGYVSAAYNYLSDDFIFRVLDEDRGEFRRPRGGPGVILIDENATGTDSGTATSTAETASSTEESIPEEPEEPTPPDPRPTPPRRPTSTPAVPAPPANPPAKPPVEPEPEPAPEPETEPELAPPDESTSTEVSV